MNKLNIQKSVSIIGQHIHKLYKGKNYIGQIEYRTTPYVPLENKYCTGRTASKFNKNQIAYLGVDKQYRNIGYGSFLVDHLSKILKKEGCKHIEVNSSSSANIFYEKNGFKPSGGSLNRWYYGLDSQYYKCI